MYVIKKIMKAILKTFIGFHESTYLKLHPDVFEAVQKGRVSSGWQHYILFGFYENRPTIPPNSINSLHMGSVFMAMKTRAVFATMLKKVFLALSVTEDQSILENSYKPVPPAHLRKRVHGDEDLFRFIKIGELVAENILDTINGKIELSEQSHILDFGCGCGRVIRNFHKSFINSRFYGTDIDREAIIWCEQNISQIGKFVINEKSPPLPFNNEFFDFVYSVSVFTHLPETMQFEWLEELRRVTKRGGHLILTTHGEELLQTASEEIRNQIRETGFYYSVGSETEGLPDFYQTSFHTEEYIHNQWSKFFEIKMIIKKGIAGYQDLILCERSN